MANLLDRNNKHLFLEKPDESDNSFIANINSLSELFKGLTSEDVLALKDITATIVSTGEEWKLILEKTALDLLAGATAFNAAIVTKITEDVPANSEITLPDTAKYVVGTNMLMLSYNGTVCYLGEQFEEIGEPNTESNKIKILFDLRTDDVLEFRVIALNTNVSNSAVIAEGSTEPRTLAERFSDIVNVKDFGAVGDGVTDDTAAIQAAIDYCASLQNGGSVVIPAPSAYYSVSRINAKSKVSVIIPNASTKIVQEKGTTWDTQTSLGVGGYFGSDYTTPTAYALNAITLGDKTATLSTASESENFQVGDCVFIESTTYFTLTTTGTYNVPAFAQMNVVESISDGVLTLRHPIQESRASVQVRNFSRTGQHTLGGTQPLEAVRDFKLLGGTWVNHYSAFNADGGCIDCEISPDVVDAVFGVPYGNCYAHCVIRVPRVITTKVPFALALAAHNTLVEIGHISCNNTASDNVKRMVELSEGCRDCTVRIGSISVAIGSTNVVEIITGRRNVVNVGHVSSPAIAGYAVYIWNPGYTGTEIPVANNNSVTINSINSPTIECGSLISGTSTEKPSGNIVSIFCSGSVTTEQTFSNVGRNIVDVRTTRWQTLERLQFDELPFSVTSTTPYTKTTTIPAGIVRTGDRLNVRLRGVSTGAAGTKSLSITFAGVTLYSYTIPAAHNQGIDVDFILEFPCNDVATSNTTAIQEGVANADDVAATGLDISSNSYNLIISISCAASGDVVAIRQATLNVSRKVIP